MIVENPYTAPHYLTTYFPIKPTVIESNRRAKGDYYKKPTQFWFVNCEPEYNAVMKPLEYVEFATIANAEKLSVGKGRKTNRSMMHPQYAERFILEYILTAPDKIWTWEQ